MIRHIRGVPYDVMEHGEGKPILLLHGFTGHAGWLSHFPELPVHYVSPSLLHHGNTGDVSVARAAMSQQIKDLSAILDTSDRPWTVVGYSLGGRIGMTLAASDKRVNHFIGISTTPGIPAEDRRTRRAADERLAKRIEERGLESFVKEWESLPLWYQTEEMRLMLRKERLSQDPYALARSLRAIGTGSMPSMWPYLHHLPRTDLLVGEYDKKFQKIARLMQQKRPDVQIHEILSAGHAPHIENAQQFGTMIEKLILGGI